MLEIGTKISADAGDRFDLEERLSQRRVGCEALPRPRQVRLHRARRVFFELPEHGTFGAVSQPPSVLDLARELHTTYCMATTPVPWDEDGWCAVARHVLKTANALEAFGRGLVGALLDGGARRRTKE